MYIKMFILHIIMNINTNLKVFSYILTISNGKLVENKPTLKSTPNKALYGVRLIIL